MNKTPFSNKCQILRDFYFTNSSDEYWSDFISMHDLGFPAAVLVVNGGATLTDVGISFVEETWQALCDELGLDYHGEYNDLSEMLGFDDE